MHQNGCAVSGQTPAGNSIDPISETAQEGGEVGEWGALFHNNLCHVVV